MNNDPQQPDNVAPAPDTQRAENGLPPLPEAAQFPWQASGRLLDEDDKLITVSARALDRFRVCIGTLNAVGCVDASDNLSEAWAATRNALEEQCSPANGMLSVVPPFNEDLRTAERLIMVQWKTARIMLTIAQLAQDKGILARIPLVEGAMREMHQAVMPIDNPHRIAADVGQDMDGNVAKSAENLLSEDERESLLSPDEWLVLDGVLRAISEIPAVHGLVVAHMLGGGWEHPAGEISNLKLRANR